MKNYFMETHNHEWILSNRLGAYALGTGNLVNQRKYHGLLTAAKPKLGREHLVAGIEEKVEWRGESFYLDSTNYSNCIYPEGFLHLVKPWLSPYPVFLYSALPHQDEILVRKEIMMDEHSNSTLIRYTNLGSHPLHFELYPKYTMCPHHEINPYGSLDFVDFEQIIRVKDDVSYFSLTRKDKGISVHSAMQKGEVFTHRNIFRKVYYPWEVMNGYEGIGDQIALFGLKFALGVGESNDILFSDAPIEDCSALAEAIVGRYAHLPKPKDYPQRSAGGESILESIDYEDEPLYAHEDYLKILRQSLDAFILEDDIVAGYPYYGIWGRDAMMVLEVLLESGGDLDLIGNILHNYSTKHKEGIMPNMHFEGFSLYEYHSIDVTLRYISLLCEYALKRQESSVFEESIALVDTLLGYIFDNQTYDFELKEDGMIYLHKSFISGTWMNAVIENEPVTPRSGAVIEVNALWYNAAALYIKLCEAHQGEKDADKEMLSKMQEIKAKLTESMQSFYNGIYLADRIEDGEAIFEMRPNAVIALSLKHSPFSQEVHRTVFSRAFTDLYTFYGLRTLSTRDHRFRKKYYGDQTERDLAYHNGSVWAWLLDPFCRLYIKAFEDEKSAGEIADVLSDFITVFHSGYIKGHIASVAEVWDGDTPHFPKGAPARAISVAAIYSVEGLISRLREKQ